MRLFQSTPSPHGSQGGKSHSRRSVPCPPALSVCSVASREENRGTAPSRRRYCSRRHRRRW